MSVDLKRSQIPSERVARVIDGRMKAFKDYSGRNPNEKERESMKSEVINLAKKIERERKG